MANTFIKGKVEFANIISREREGDRTSVSDMTLVPIILGWHKGNFHVITLNNVYVPVGDYSASRILNTGLGKHPIGANLRYYDELTVTNRLSGQFFFGPLNFVLASGGLGHTVVWPLPT